MNILWISNILFPDVCETLSIPMPYTGGWMFSSAKKLVEIASVNLSVASVYPGEDLQILHKNNITYYLVPLNRSDSKNTKLSKNDWLTIKSKANPHIIHIHGTEYPYGMAFMHACGSENTIVSIQGLVSVYERYYHYGMNSEDILKNITFRDLIQMDTIFQQRIKMRSRGNLEKEYIRTAKYIIGRTSWDKSHIWAINPYSKYYFCNETLRDEFYKHSWSLDRCEKHSIFVSQAAYPIKGLHQLLKALPLVLKTYPDTKLYIAGYDFVSTKTWKDKIRRGGYGKYIKQIIETLNIQDKVSFTGPLQEKEICERYVASHVFVCPSSIENSPNSLGEAQLLGVPCVSSYVGGIPDMVEHRITGLLYPFEEHEMLGSYIVELFGNPDLANSLSANSRVVAQKRHSALENNSSLLKIYNDILSL